VCWKPRISECYDTDEKYIDIAEVFTYSRMPKTYCVDGVHQNINVMKSFVFVLSEHKPM